MRKKARKKPGTSRKRRRVAVRAGARKAVRSTGKFQPTEEETRPLKFTPMETGQVERDEGRGPLGQEGEGERQNDQLAELERISPEESPPARRSRRLLR